MTNFGGETSVSQTDVWLTPPNIIQALGVFDLDPCAATNRPWDTALNHYTKADDGLRQAWAGRVWLNPPYGPPMSRWLERLSEHPGGGVALIFARTETRVFFDFVWDRAHTILFLKGRVKFHRPDGSIAGSSGSPSVLVGYGQREAQSLRQSGLSGKLVTLKGKS